MNAAQLYDPESGAYVTVSHRNGRWHWAVRVGHIPSHKWAAGESPTYPGAMTAALRCLEAWHAPQLTPDVST